MSKLAMEKFKSNWR